MTEKIEAVVLVHGGAWDVPQKWTKETLDGVKISACIGMKILRKGGSPLDAVEGAVMIMEENKYFNAGKGSSLNYAGEVQMEASIMRGSDLEAGATNLVNFYRHPVHLARKIMEESKHVSLGGEGAKLFAMKQGLEILPEKYFVTDEAMEELSQHFRTMDQSRQDTVGAVAIDSKGNVASATSTGGIVGKHAGRIGDVSQIGCGTYADDMVGAVSSTGHGETIARACLSHTIIKSMEAGMSPQEAVTKSLDNMTARLKNFAGSIAVSNKGEVGIHFTTPRMSWCFIRGDEIHYGIDKDQHEIENLKRNKD